MSLPSKKLPEAAPADPNAELRGRVELAELNLRWVESQIGLIEGRKRLQKLRAEEEEAKPADA